MRACLAEEMGQQGKPRSAWTSGVMEEASSCSLWGMLGYLRTPRDLSTRLRVNEDEPVGTEQTPQSLIRAVNHRVRKETK